MEPLSESLSITKRLNQMKLNSLRISSALNLSGQSGVYSNQKFNSGDIVLVLRGRIVTEATRTSIQVSDLDHIEDEIGHYINHHCDSTCKIDGKNVIAIRDINIDDEITFNYSQSENVIASPFICACCNKLISGKLNS